MNIRIFIGNYFGISEIFSSKEINTFILQLNGSKVTVKTCIMLQNISISNKCCSFYLSKNPEKKESWNTQNV